MKTLSIVGQVANLRTDCQSVHPGAARTPVHPPIQGMFRERFVGRRHALPSIAMRSRRVVAWASARSDGFSRHPPGVFESGEAQHTTNGAQHNHEISNPLHFVP
jgi:hypothetical protein